MFVYDALGRVIESVAQWPLAVRSHWQRFQRLPFAQRAYLLTATALLAAGIALRLMGQVSGRSSLWADEAKWANRLLEQPLLSLSIRPIGFMWLTKKLVDVFAANEIWLRFVPNVASIIALLLVPYIASQLLKGKFARLLLLFLFALHPALIDLSKEFKPYSLEVLVHMLPIAIYLRYRQTGRLRYFYGLLALLPISFLFAYNFAFAYPGVLLLMLWKSWPTPQRMRALAATLLAGVLCLAVVGAVYSRTLTTVKRPKTESYWGGKYGVFYTAKDTQKHGTWVIERYSDMAALPGLRRTLWKSSTVAGSSTVDQARSLEHLMWVLAHLLGVYALFKRRRWDEALLLVVPPLVLVGINALGYWPLGAFRTNLFVCAYALPLASIGLDWIAQLSRLRTWITASLVLALSILPGFVLGFDWHASKQTWTREHHARVVLKRLRRLREEHLEADANRPAELVLLDTHTWHSYRFYVRHHPTFTRDEFYKQNFVSERSSRRKLATRLRRAQQPIWVIASKNLEASRDRVRQVGEILFEERVRGEHLIMLVGRK